MKAQRKMLLAKAAKFALTALLVSSLALTGCADDDDDDGGDSAPPANVKVTGVTLDKTTASVDVGATTKLTAVVSPEGATDKTVSWESDTLAVATVDKGVVTGVSVGTAKITVTTNDGDFTDTCTVTVTAAKKKKMLYEQNFGDVTDVKDVFNFDDNRMKAEIADNALHVYMASDGGRNGHTPALDIADELGSAYVVEFDAMLKGSAGYYASELALFDTNDYPGTSYTKYQRLTNYIFALGQSYISQTTSADGAAIDWWINPTKYSGDKSDSGNGWADDATHKVSLVNTTWYHFKIEVTVSDADGKSQATYTITQKDDGAAVKITEDATSTQSDSVTLTIPGNGKINGFWFFGRATSYSCKLDNIEVYTYE